MRKRATALSLCVGLALALGTLAACAAIAGLEAPPVPEAPSEAGANDAGADSPIVRPDATADARSGYCGTVRPQWAGSVFFCDDFDNSLTPGENWLRVNGTSAYMSFGDGLSAPRSYRVSLPTISDGGTSVVADLGENFTYSTFTEARFSFAFRIREAAEGFTYVADFDVGTTPRQTVDIYLDRTGDLYGRIIQSATQMSTLLGTPAVGTWYTIAALVRAGSVSFTLNGASAGTASIAATPTGASQAFRIGVITGFGPAGPHVFDFDNAFTEIH